MAKVTITLTDHPETPEGLIEMDQTVTIEVAGAQYTNAICSPAILLGIAFRRLLDNDAYAQQFADSVANSPTAFWDQLRELTGACKAPAARETPNVNG